MELFGEVELISIKPLLWLLVSGFILIAVGGLVMLRRRKRFRKRREKLLNSALDREWERILEKNFPIYRKMPDHIRFRLGGYVNAFVEEKSFEGCGGLGQLTDEMLVTVAGQACILLLNGKFGVFDSMQSVLLYPNAYDVKDSRDRSGMVRKKSRRLGESWGSGSVVLSWAHVVSGPAIPHDGRNLVIHEFAHQLDQRDGVADGAPALFSREERVKWAGAFRDAYQLHGKYMRGGKKLVIDEYGATNPAEFFAVATETFFEKPQKLMERYPQIYERLRLFYELDPLQWR
jgi:Mlc titration factor MtfA (ptsG expression regulator)